MTRLSEHDLATILARYETFSGSDAQAMGFAEYSELYDQFVERDLPRLMEHVRFLESENERLRSSRLHGGRRGR